MPTSWPLPPATCGHVTAAGGDRLALYRYGLGSLREVNGILLTVVAFGWLEEAPMAAERDRLGAILFGLQRS